MDKAYSQQREIQAVIFDLDGVLMDSERLAFHAWRQWASLYGGELKESDFSGMIGLTAEDTATYVIERTKASFNMADGCAWTWQWVLDRLREGNQPLPGAVELLSGLTARGYPLAIASNAFTGYIDDALEGLCLSDYFSVRVSVDDVAQGKPAPDVYLSAASRLGCDPRNCLAIEDSRVGLQAATAAGMRVIVVPGAHDHSNGFHAAWRMYPSLVQVSEDLDRILGESSRPI
jgi:HAD superfamily hydrolase (TIGR01509 family)